MSREGPLSLGPGFWGLTSALPLELQQLRGSWAALVSGLGFPALLICRMDPATGEDRVGHFLAETRVSSGNDNNKRDPSLSTCCRQMLSQFCFSLAHIKLSYHTDEAWNAGPARGCPGSGPRRPHHAAQPAGEACPPPPPLALSTHPLNIPGCSFPPT